MANLPLAATPQPGTGAEAPLNLTSLLATGSLAPLSG